MIRIGLGLLLAAIAGNAQQYTITTVAGSPAPPTPIAALSVSVGAVNAAAIDAFGTVYFTSSFGCVLRMTPDRILTRVAGTCRRGNAGDGGLATSAQIGDPAGIALDGGGNLYIADQQFNVVRRVSTSGIISTVVGTGTAGSSGDGGPAINAQLAAPTALVFDSASNLYIADTGNHRIRRVTPSGFIGNFAGSGIIGNTGDGGAAVSARLNSPSGLAVNSAGEIFIADTGNHRVRGVLANGFINGFAGNGTRGDSGDGDLAGNAQFAEPRGLAFDADGRLYIADSGSHRLRVVVPALTRDQNGAAVVVAAVLALAGTGASGYSGDGGKAIDAKLSGPFGVVMDASKNAYVADGPCNCLREVTEVTTGNGSINSNAIINTVAGNGQFSYSGDGGPAGRAQLFGPYGVAVDSQGNLYFSDRDNQRVRRIGADGVIVTIAGTGESGYSVDVGPARSAKVNLPSGVAVDGAGNVYFADSGNNRIRKITPGGVISTVAGNGNLGFSGDGEAAVNSTMRQPAGIALGNDGTLYIADTGNNRVRKVAPDGNISTVAGTGIASFAGDGGRATAAQLSGPYGVAPDVAGNLYIADTGNNRIRKVSADGIITTVAGSTGIGSSGDEGPATAAQLRQPTAVALDSAGSLLIADSGNNRVRRVSLNGIITTVAGNGAAEYSGDGGPAVSASLSEPRGLAVDSKGRIYVTDYFENVVRVLDASNAGFQVTAVTDAASNLPGAVAPGEIVVLYGSGLGPAQLQQFKLTADGLVGSDLGGTRVLFNGTPAPVIYSSGTQVSAIVPYSVSGAAARVEVEYQGRRTASVTVPVAAALPAIFTLDSSGTGPAAALNQDYKVNTAANPARPGGVVILYCTGEGQTMPEGVDGKPAATPLPVPRLPVRVTVGGQQATVLYAGGASGLVAGVMQVNVQLPNGLPADPATPVVLMVGSALSAAGVTIAVGGN